MFWGTGGFCWLIFLVHGLNWFKPCVNHHLKIHFLKIIFILKMEFLFNWKGRNLLIISMKSNTESWRPWVKSNTMASGPGKWNIYEFNDGGPSHFSGLIFLDVGLKAFSVCVCGDIIWLITDYVMFFFFFWDECKYVNIRPLLFLFWGIEVKMWA